MSRFPLAAGLLALLLLHASCGSTVAETDPGDGGRDAGVDARPEPDPCEALDRESCCDAGCDLALPVASPQGIDPVCVAKSRLCYVEGDCAPEPYEKECPPGYECVATNYPCPDLCSPGGEFVDTGRGYCFWTGP